LILIFILLFVSLFVFAGRWRRLSWTPFGLFSGCCGRGLARGLSFDAVLRIGIRGLEEGPDVAARLISSILLKLKDRGLSAALLR